MQKFELALADYDAAVGKTSLSPGMFVTMNRATALYGRGLAKHMMGNSAGDADIAEAKQLDPKIVERFVRDGVPAL